MDSENSATSVGSGQWSVASLQGNDVDRKVSLCASDH
jgi:hypothetical protein